MRITNTIAFAALLLLAACGAPADAGSPPLTTPLTDAASADIGIRADDAATSPVDATAVPDRGAPSPDSPLSDASPRAPDGAQTNDDAPLGSDSNATPDGRAPGVEGGGHSVDAPASLDVGAVDATSLDGGPLDTSSITDTPTDATPPRRQRGM